MKLKKGDIILNRWAGENNPTKVFIYTGSSGRYVNGVQFMNGRLSKTQYYKHSLDEPFHDGEPAFIKVGHTETYEVMKNDLMIHQKEADK